MCRTNNGALKSSNINSIFLWRFLIQNHSQPPITDKTGSKANYLISNSIRLKFVKKTMMPNLAKSHEYIKWYSSSSPRPPKSPKTLSDTAVKRSVVDREDLKPYWISEKSSYFSRWSQSHYLQVLPRPTTERRLRAVIFKLFQNIFKYRDHRWNLPTIWKTRLLQTLLFNWRVQLVSKKVQAYSFFRTTSEIQSQPELFDESRLVITILNIWELQKRDARVIKIRVLGKVFSK